MLANHYVETVERRMIENVSYAHDAVCKKKNPFVDKMESNKDHYKDKTLSLTKHRF